MRTQIRSRNGTIVPLLAISLIAIFAFVALALDIGMMTVVRSDCQNAADAAALAGARELDGTTGNNLTTAISTATSVATTNYIMTKPVTAANISSINPGLYTYTSASQRFQADFGSAPTSTESWTVIQVGITNTYQPVFGSFFGLGSLNISAQATATHRPRDIAIVLDFSISMAFGSDFNYWGAKSLESLNPDPNYPRIGPWSIYNGAGMWIDPTNPGPTPSNLNTYVPPTPMQRIWQYQGSDGQVYGPSNITYETAGGPPIVTNFLLTDGVTNAFVGTYGSTLPTFYNVNDTANAAGNPKGIITPVPSTYWNQTATTFIGDGFPLRSGVSTPSAGTSITPDQYAQTVADYVGISRSSVTNSTKNTTFEQYGYDWDFTKNQLKPNSQKYQGFTVGAGYYGKTFYMWPPDPRTPVGNIGDSTYVAGDWRQRFFIAPSGSGKTTQDNSIFWNTSNGVWNNQYNGSTPHYIPNYTAILTWLTRGPQVMPTSMESGRVVYYSSIPTSIPVSSSTGYISSGASADQCFWKDYIDYVLGAGNWSQSNNIYGTNGNNSNNGGGSTLYYNNPATSNLTNKVTAKTWSGAPYMNYTDNPVHPRCHFWFGPLTMMCYLQVHGGNWNPGTCYEAQDWQLKVGINAALNDIQTNHPNDLAALIYFSSRNDFNGARVQMSKNYTTMQNCLFYPYNLLSNLGDPTQTIRPYNTGGAGSSGNPSSIWDNSWPIPNGNNGTDPMMGFLVAYNEFSSYNGYYGRNGATKIVIFETDGVPNYVSNGQFNNRGATQSTYTSISTGTYYGISTSLQAQPKVSARSIVKQIAALNTAASPGYSTARQPAYVHSVGFGYLFEPANASSLQTDAIEFLFAVQVDGNTSPTPSNPNWDQGATGSVDVTPYTVNESYKLIIGDYNTRIAKIQQCMQRIMQGGVQIALIQ